MIVEKYTTVVCKMQIPGFDIPLHCRRIEEENGDYYWESASIYHDRTWGSNKEGESNLGKWTRLKKESSLLEELYQNKLVKEKRL